MILRALILISITLCSYAHHDTYIHYGEGGPITNDLTHYHWTNSYSGKMYHQSAIDPYGYEAPPPYVGQYVHDAFGTDSGPVQDAHLPEEVGTSYINCTFNNTIISNLTAYVKVTHCSGSAGIHARRLDAAFAVFEDATIQVQNEVDISYASLIGTTLTAGSAIFKDTNVRDANLNLSFAEGSVRGVPNYLSPGIKIKNGNLIGMSVNNDGANFSYCDLTDVQFNNNSSYVGANFTGCIISNLASGNFSNANFGGAVVSNFGQGASFPEVLNASFIVATLEGVAHANLTNAGAILQYTHIAGSGVDPATNFYDYYGAATNIFVSLVEYTNQLKVVSNQVSTASNQSVSLSASIENTAINWDVILDNLDAEVLFLEDDMGALSNQVVGLSNKVISTIHELEPDIEVIGASNGNIAISMELRSSGDLQNWQSVYDKTYVGPTSNDVQYFRLNIAPQKGQ